MQEQPLAARQLIAYGAPALPLAALTLPVYVYLPQFYAQEMGLGLATVGLVLLLARIWDVFTDPVIGILSDRTPLRWGRRRAWVLAGTPLVMLAVWTLLVPGQGAGWAHLLGWSLVLYLGWSMVILPLNAWGAELSTAYHERTRIAGFREGAVLLGTLVALTLPPLLGVGEAGEAREALRIIAILVLVLLPPTVLALVVLTPEPRVRRHGAVGFVAGLRLMADNRPFRRLILAYLVNAVANGLPATLFLLFVEHVLRAGDEAGVLLLVYFLCGLLGVPLWVRLSRRFGKNRTWCGAMLASCGVFIWAPFLAAGDVGWFVVVCVLTGLCVGADLVLPSAMQADVVDEDTAVSGAQRTGLFFAVWSMATKLSLALAVGLAFPVLDFAGFSEDGASPPEALAVLAVLYGGVPVIFKLMAIVLMRGYVLTADRQRTLRDQLDESAEPG